MKAAGLTGRTATSCGSLALALAFAACASQNNIPVETGCTGACKAHPDAGSPGRPDSGTADAGPIDAGPDAGGGTVDAGLDAGPDAGFDAGPEDAGAADGGPLTGQVCPAGSVAFSGRTLDLCQRFSQGTDVPLDGVQIATLDPYSATVSADGGYYVACLPPGVPATLQYTMPGYETGYLAEFVLTAPLPTNKSNIGEAWMLCNSAVKNYGAEDPQFSTTLPFVYSLVLSLTGMPPCGGPDGGLAGWVFSASPADGGEEDGGSWPAAYLDATGTFEAIGSTLPDGEGIVYDIDPGVGYVTLSVNKPSVAAECLPLDLDIGLTGRVHVAANTFSVFPWLVP